MLTMWNNILLADIVLMLWAVTSAAEVTSKACYGSTKECSYHKLNCVSGSITIYNAYYTNNSECSVHGLSSCRINVNNITETGHHINLNETELGSLCRTCSGKKECGFEAGRRKGHVNFSVVKYACINSAELTSKACYGTTKECPYHISCDTTTSSSRKEQSTITGDTTTSSSRKEQSTITDSSTGAVAGGIVAAILVIVAVVLVLLWLKCKRSGNTTSNPNIGQADVINHIMATPISDHKTGSNYDYATVGDDRTQLRKGSSPKTEDDYYQVGRTPSTITGHYVATAVLSPDAVNKDDNYNHFAAKKTTNRRVHSPGYDTAASASQAVQQIRTEGTLDVDNYYSYDHTDKKPKTKHLICEYDTPASAAKVVAQVIEKAGHNENDYDYFQQAKFGVQALDSPYDIAENQSVQTGDYSVLGAVEKHDPYDLAK